MNTFKLDVIDAILNKQLQPWADSNERADSSYREILSKTPEIPMPTDLKYQLKYERHILFTYRVRYYCRLTDNAVADHLRQAFNTIDSDQNEYMAAYLLKLTREAVTTLIADAIIRSRNLSVTSVDLTDFNDKRREKECLIILHYVIASLVRCWMEMQDRYQYVCDQSDLQDVASFYASVVGRVTDSIAYVEQLEDKKESGNKQPKISTCSFLYINNDEFDRNTSLTAFYNKLIKYKQIPTETDQKHLFAIFGGKSTNCTVKWIGKEATLKTIIFKLKEKETICTWPKEYSIWDVITHRFKDKDGNPMKDLSSYKEGMKTKDMVADIISTLC
jgi:hypothetical protein